MNNKDRFESWFLNINRHNGKRTKNIGAFIGYLKQVANDVNKTEGAFYRIPSVEELKEIERLLINSSSFQGRSIHAKRNLKSGLHTYMRFMKWKIDQSLQRSKARQKKTSNTKLPAEIKPKSPLRIKKEKIAQVSPTLLTLKKIDKKREGFLKIELLAFNFDGSGNALIRGFDEKGKSSLLPLDKSMLNEVLWGDGKSSSNYTTE